MNARMSSQFVLRTLGCYITPTVESHYRDSDVLFQNRDRCVINTPASSHFVLAWADWPPMLVTVRAGELGNR